MKFTKTVLPSGLRVITIPMQDNPAATVLVMVETGSQYESKNTNGISYFLEHMVFKGTLKRPKASMISRELDSLGADSNAFTGEEYTGYYAKADPKRLDTALDIISDMYLNPLFEESEISKEKGVIIEEIRMYRDRPERQVHEAIGRLMYGEQPAGMTVLGPEDNIRKFTRKDFLSYREKHYVAHATTVIVAGDIQEKAVVKKVEKLFAKISTSKKHEKVKVKSVQARPQLLVVHKKTDQTHLILGFHSFSTFDKRMPAMRVLTALLGRGMSSRLFVKMREELGICYYIHASHYAATDFGDFTVSAGVDTARVEIGIKTILAELSQMTTGLVSTKELKKAKDYSAGTMMLGLETSDAQAEYVGFQEILRKSVQTPDEVIAEMQKVTAEDIRELAREIFVDSNLNLAVVGPYEDENRFKPFLTFK